MQLKYIIIEQAGVEIPIVFPELLPHEVVAGRSRVKSAGFCELDAEAQWQAGGKSVSLGLNSRPQDTEILNFHLGWGLDAVSAGLGRKS